MYLFIKVAILVLFLDGFLYKVGFMDWFKGYGSVSKRKWVYELSMCDFCKHFHLGLIVTVICFLCTITPGLCMIIDSEVQILEFLYTPFLSSGLLIIINKL